MLTVGMGILGLVIGFFRARGRGGSIGDQIQWALAHGIGLALLTLVLGTLYLQFTS